MISIGKPYVSRNGDRAELHAPVRITADTAECYLEKTDRLVNSAWLTKYDYPPAAWNEEGSSLWFSAPAEYERYLCTERSDAFVIAMLWYGMFTGSDISFEAPLSRKLYDGLTQRLIPALAGDGHREIKLDGPVSDEPIWHEDGVVAGMSCGVDSLYTLACYGGDDAPQGMKLTHLVYYDNNYLFPRYEPPYDLDEIYRRAGLPHAEYARRARIVAANHELPLIYVRNNICRDYYRGARIYTSMYRFLACTLALAHLYGTYISSSSGHDDNVDVSLLAPTQHYENLICESCGTDTLRYVSSDNETRSVKLRRLADDADTQSFLAVCYQPDEHGNNCGECYACWKTMIPLDIMGKLRGFSGSFDLDKYYRDRKKVFGDLIRFSQRPEASSARDSVRQFIRLASEEQSEAGKEFADVWHELNDTQD